MFMLRPLVILATLALSIVARAESITVSAAVSLKESLQAIAKDYTSATGETVEFNIGASGQLLAQVKQGAPVDAFISAAQGPLDELKVGHLAAGPDRIIARNELVLIVPAKGKPIDGFAQLASPDVKRIGVGQPKTVPAGEYAMQVLDKLSLTDVVKDRLIYGANVRQVLDYVIRGEVDAGIVYRTDALEAGKAVRVMAVSSADWHRPIVYPAVVLSGRKQAASARFLDYLLAAKAQAILHDHGFAAGGAP
jgi:molybdate transport system substrate-binding protein